MHEEITLISMYKVSTVIYSRNFMTNMNVLVIILVFIFIIFFVILEFKGVFLMYKQQPSGLRNDVHG